MKEAPYAFGSTYEREVAFDDATWRRRVTDRTRFVAEVDDVVAGTVSGGDGEVNGSAAMTAMWVDPRYRRQGVGEVLVKTLLEWGRAEGYGQMFLWVTEVNARAEHLYLRHGFVRTGASQEVRPGELEHEMSRTL
ncbi:MAG TPA: GNAT family N-acetyltransferase [Candidatus Dormibacteraeota bacterium]